MAISVAVDDTGNAGLYYVCCRLSLLGWNVMPTARNARGIDVVAYSADGGTMKGIQVKALSKRNPVPLGTDLESSAVAGRAVMPGMPPHSGIRAEGE